MNPILLFPFQDDSPSFVDGFETGVIWQKCEQSEGLSAYMAHTRNRSTIEDIFVHFGYYFMITVIDDLWMEINAHPVQLPEFLLL